jgi:hypothetical protein
MLGGVHSINQIYNDDLTTRSGDRRPKSAKTRNRVGRWSECWQGGRLQYRPDLPQKVCPKRSGPLRPMTRRPNRSPPPDASSRGRLLRIMRRLHYEFPPASFLMASTTSPTVWKPSRTSLEL